MIAVMSFRGDHRPQPVVQTNWTNVWVTPVGDRVLWGGRLRGGGNRNSHLLNSPMIFASASLLKCKLKPTTAADVSTFTSSLSAFTANMVKR
jgi:hypothetical protein